VPGREAHLPAEAREETLLEAVQEGWRKEKAALVAELEQVRAEVKALEARLTGSAVVSK